MEMTDEWSTSLKGIWGLSFTLKTNLTSVPNHLNIIKTSFSPFFLLCSCLFISVDQMAFRLIHVTNKYLWIPRCLSRTALSICNMPVNKQF